MIRSWKTTFDVLVRFISHWRGLTRIELDETFENLLPDSNDTIRKEASNKQIQSMSIIAVQSRQAIDNQRHVDPKQWFSIWGSRSPWSHQAFF